MSKLSRFFIGVMVAGMAFIASVHFYHAYERYAASQEEADGGATQTFHHVPIDYRPEQPGLPVIKRLAAPGEEIQEIYLEDRPLTSTAEKEQARQTVASILSDYRQDPALQAFYTDLQKTTGRKIELTDLSGENLSALLRQYPQAQEVIARHAKDPILAKTLQEIFSNPQFVRSVAVLQGKEQPAN